ncbi:MAG: hypothetical protein MK085_01540 [Phycisphaerales bacterium]|nr:hypothetical protein [Phycisphaerales bacterium]
MHHRSLPRSRGNGLVITVIVLAILIAAGVAFFLTWADGMTETIENETSSTAVQRDSELQPVAMWAADPIVKYASANNGALPDDKQGNAMIAEHQEKVGRPEIEGVNNFTVTPIYRRMGKGNFEIVVPTSEIGGKAHLVFPFNAAGDSLAPVPDHVFLSENQQAENPLEEEPSEGVGK